jgi:hypothetical protein
VVRPRRTTDLSGRRQNAREAVTDLLLEPFTGVGEGNCAVIALEQSRANRNLESADRLADGRLRRAKFFGSAEQRRQVGGRLEGHEFACRPDASLKLSQNVILCCSLLHSIAPAVATHLGSHRQSKQSTRNP